MTERERITEAMMGVETTECRLAIAYKKPMLPDNPYDGGTAVHKVYDEAQQDMINAGFIEEMRR